MKLHFRRNDPNEKTSVKSFISGYFIQTVVRDDIEWKIFHLAENEISRKHPVRLITTTIPTSP